MVCWLVNQNCFTAKPFMAHSLLLFGLIQPKLVVCWLINHNCFIASSPISQLSHWPEGQNTMGSEPLVAHCPSCSVRLLPSSKWVCEKHDHIRKPELVHLVLPNFTAEPFMDHLLIEFAYYGGPEQCVTIISSSEKTTSVSCGFVCPTLRVKTGKRGQAPQLPVPRCAPTFQTPFFHAPFPGS